MRSWLAVGAAILLFLSFFSPSQAQTYVKLSTEDHPDYSRVILETSFPLSYEIEKGSSFILVKIRVDMIYKIDRGPFESRIIRSFGWTKGSDYYILTIKVKPRDFTYDHFVVKDPIRLIIDFFEAENEVVRAREELRREGVSQSKTQSFLADSILSRSGHPSSVLHEIRAIVIDPGHGGMEPGAKGKGGTLEKNITLAISLKLKDLIERNLALRVVLSRERDETISLENRAAIANNNKADLFLSIHTNSSFRKDARGPETFFLSSEATDEEARRLAYIENNPAEIEAGIAGENEDEVTMILWDMAQSAYLKQSSLLAESIQEKLNSLLRTRNRGIKQAPFKVLTGVACPAVLIEVAFISNTREERQMLTERFQMDVASAVYEGLVNYIRTHAQKPRIK